MCCRYAGFVVLTLRSPHLLEGTEGKQDRPPSLTENLRASWWGHHLDSTLDGANAVISSVMRSPMTWNMVVQHDVGVQVFANVNVALHDA